MQTKSEAQLGNKLLFGTPDSSSRNRMFKTNMHSSNPLKRGKEAGLTRNTGDLFSPLSKGITNSDKT